MNAKALSKWWLVTAYWIVQAAVIHFGGAAWYASAENVDGSGNLGTFSWSDYRDVALSAWWLFWSSITIGAIMLAQLIFVWPVRKPAPKNERGWPIKVSLGVAALAIAMLCMAIVMTVIQSLYSLANLNLFDEFHRHTGVSPNPWWGTLIGCLLTWAVVTPLLIRFCTRGPRESLLARVASRIFVGTVVEMAAIIPLDVMVRKRENCYCLTGTYFAMLMFGAVGMFVLGPALLLPIVARRRKRWYDGKCEWCGYDMTPTPRADRCPECGMGWRAGSGQAAGDAPA